MKEWFQFRNDMLEQRKVDHVDKVTVERFSHGRRFHLQRKSASSRCSGLYRLIFGFDFDVRGGTTPQRYTRPTTTRHQQPLTRGDGPTVSAFVWSQFIDSQTRSA